MVTKTTGAELKRFYSDTKFWPEHEADGENGPWHEDECIDVDGEVYPPDADIMKIADDAMVRVDGGVVSGARFKDGEGPSFEGYFKRWRKEQAKVTLVVECDVGKRDEVLVALKRLGVKLVG